VTGKKRSSVFSPRELVTFSTYTANYFPQQKIKQEIWANAHEMRKSLLQFIFAGNLGLSPSISSQFTLLQPKIVKKTH